jgi:AcrR family transcriptional regulator
MAISGPLADESSGPPTEKARATRAALISTAGEYFVDDGYGAVSVRDLARRMQLTSGAIYGHFRSKADLLVAAIRERIASDLEAPYAGRALGLVGHLTAQARAYRSRAGMRALLVEGAAAGRVDPDIRQQLRELQSAKLAEWHSIYRELQDRGEIGADVDVATLVDFVWAAELGLGVLEALDVDLPKPGRWAETVRRAVQAFTEPRKVA